MLLASPLKFLYILAEKEQLEKGYAPAKGILWAEVNPFNDDIHVHVFSIDKEYQNNGAMAEGIKKVGEIRDIEKLNGKIVTTTTRPKALEKVELTQSKRIYMELSYE